MHVNYAIISKSCPFGNGAMINGVMDNTQFVSCHDLDYRADKDSGILAILVAQQYGGKPVADIQYDGGVIHVYKVAGYYAAVAEAPDGWRTTSNAMWRNTVNPAAIVEHFAARVTA